MDILLVLDHDRLYNDLNETYRNKGAKIVKLQKSGGVLIIT